MRPCDLLVSTPRVALVLGLATLAACRDAASPSEPGAPNDSTGFNVNPNAYIVVFKDRVTDPVALANELVATYGGKLRYVYQYALKGFAAELPKSAVPEIQKHPDVAYIELDNKVYEITSARSVPLIST